MADPHNLERYCRVCSGLLHKSRKKGTTYSCSTHQQSLSLTFGLDVVHDSPSIHPTEFCDQCYATTLRKRSADAKGMPYSHSVTIFIWEEHKEEQCSVSNTRKVIANSHVKFYACVQVCDHLSKISREKGGGKNKKKQ